MSRARPRPEPRNNDRRHHLHRSNSTKVAALTMLKNGVKSKTIQESLRIPKSTFFDWVRKARESGTMTAAGDGAMARPAPHKAGQGRPTKVTDVTKAEMRRKLERNPFLTSAELCACIPALANVSPRTVRRICLKDLKLPSRVSRLKPLLTQAQKLRWLSWARKRAHWRKKRWNRVLWMDETHIEIWTNTHRSRKVRRSTEDNPLDPKFIRSSIKHPIKLMCWASMGNGKLGKIMIVPDEDVEPRRGGAKKQKRMNQVVYKETLQKHLRASFGMTGTSILMQDGAPCHRARSISAWFAENPDIKVLPWPGQSPDQNPIEQLFAILKWEVAMLPPATNREELKLRILQGWRNLGRRRDILRNLCNSMPRRVAALLDSQGGPTKY